MWGGVYYGYLEIDKSKITDESIRKYGVEITEDGYRFIAKKEAVVNNTCLLYTSRCV